MIKKIVSILLVLSIILSFSACTGSKKNEPVTESTTQITTVKVTIPEGYTLVRISWLLEENGLCTSDDFINACQTYTEWLDLDIYPFLKDVRNIENVCFYLEGYFFPLTYDIPETATAQDIVKIFLNGTKKIFSESFMQAVFASGYTLHEILTIASIIEKEAKLDDQRPMISSVIHNRISAGMKIQCDPTVKYCDGVIKLIYPEKYEQLVPYYSTYICNGLIAGPICNPGIKSIESAVNPAETEYLYFIIGTVPPYESKYSKTFAEHDAFWQANKDKLTSE